MSSSFLRALSATTALVSLLAGSAALADCQPDPAASGQTVTCTATDTNGFNAGAAQNLRFTVLSDGVVTTTLAASNVVTLNSANTVVNSGLIVQQGTGNFDAIRLDGSGNVVTNLGVIVASGNVSNGIRSLGSGNTITNAGSIVASGNTVFGIWLSGVNADTAINSGTITASGTNARGIVVDSAASAVVNSGTIIASGAVSLGIDLRGSGSTLVNSGTVTASGVSGFAVLLNAVNNGVLTNSGTITASGANTPALLLANSTGITATNSGVIRAIGAGTVALSFDTGSIGTAFTNAPGGLIYGDAGANTRAIGFTIAAGTGVLNNFGTIDGRIATTAVNVVNAGLIQITTGAVGLTHTVGVFTQLAGGTLALRVNGIGTHDTLATNATTVLGGTLRAAVQPALYNNVTLYPNVVTNPVGLGGQFASAVSSSPFFTASAAQGPGAVHLTLTRIPFGAVAGLTQNQLAIGNALEAAYSPGAAGNAATIFGTILGGTTVPFDGLSGEVGAGVQNPSFAMGDAFMNAISGQAQRWRGGAAGAPGTQSASMRVQFAAAQPTFELSRSYAQATAPGAEPWPPRSVGPHWAAWASGFGLSGNRDGDGSVGSARLGYSMGGGAFGADVQIMPNLLLGGAVGGAGSDFSLDGRSATGTARAVTFALYGSWTMGPLYVDATAAYGLAQFSTTRIATQGTILERATGDFDGHQVGGRVEAGWRFMVQRYALTPFAGLTVQSLHQDGYSESSSNFNTGAPGILGLSYQDQTTTSVRSTLGAQAATRFQLGERMTLTPRVRAAWAHEFNADRQVGASFLSIPGAAFTVNGARPARDAALVSAGVDVGIGRHVTVYAQFDSELAGSGNAYAGSGGLRVSW